MRRKPSVVRLALGIAAISLLSAACNKEKAATPDSSQTAATPAAAPAGEVTPGPGGTVIPIELITDEKGNYFSPATVEAKNGDVLRFTLKAGVHNVDFLADSNPGKSGLPKASDMLQLPGQTYDVAVSFAAGKYYFQCDPHAALGMKGTLTVK